MSLQNFFQKGFAGAEAKAYKCCGNLGGVTSEKVNMHDHYLSIDTEAASWILHHPGKTAQELRRLRLRELSCELKISMRDIYDALNPNPHAYMTDSRLQRLLENTQLLFSDAIFATVSYGYHAETIPAEIIKKM